MSADRKQLGSIAMGGLTPLLDTLFILIFATLVSSDARRPEDETELRVQLPRVEDGAALAVEAALGITLVLDADSRIEMFDTGEDVSTRATLDAALTARHVGYLPEDVTIEIRADSEARYGVAVELLQHLRLAGFTDVDLFAQGFVGDPAAPFGEGHALETEER